MSDLVLFKSWLHRTGVEFTQVDGENGCTTLLLVEGYLKGDWKIAVEFDDLGQFNGIDGNK